MNPPQGLGFEAELLKMSCSMALSLPVPAQRRQPKELVASEI